MPAYYIAAMILAGLAVRCFVIGTFYPNADEAWHIHTAGRPSFRDVIACIFAEEAHPPLNYLLLHALMQISDALVVIRLLFVLPWVLWIIVCYRIGLLLGGERYGLWWAALAALSNGALDYSLMIREYMWMLLFLTGQFYFFIRLYRQPSYRAALYYFLCGIVAIAFEFSAAMTIFMMGVVLAWRMLQMRFRPLRLWMVIMGSHLLQAAFLLSLYLQYNYLRLDHHIRWDMSVYFTSSPRAFFEFLASVINFVIPVHDVVWLSIIEILGLIILFFITARPFWRWSPVMAVYAGMSIPLMLALNFFKWYPRPAELRFMIWMLPGIMVWLAFMLDYVYTLIPAARRQLVAVVAGAGLSACVAAHFAVPYAVTTQEYAVILKATEAIGARDIVFTDIQTMFQIEYRSDWQTIAHYQHLDEAKWRGLTVYYPNWRKLESVDTRTGERAGSIGLHKQSLVYVAQWMKQQQRQGAVPPFVWILHVGFPSQLSHECSAAMGHYGDTALTLKDSFLVRFTPKQFFDFLAHCPKEPDPV